MKCISIDGEGHRSARPRLAEFLSGSMLAVCGLLICVAGCGGDAQERWEVSFDFPYQEFCPPVRILDKGVVVAEYALRMPGDPVESQTVHGRLFAEDQVFHEDYDGERSSLKSINADFRFEQLTPGGWKEVLHPRGRTGERTWGQLKQKVTLFLPRAVDYLIVDNRDHGIATIQCGELELIVAANSAQVFRINPEAEDLERGRKVETTDAEHQAASWEMKMGDKVIGTMHKGTPCLIDVSGQRKYVLKEVVYSNLLLPDLEPYSETLEQNYLHELPSWLKEVRYLFKLAPLETKTTDLHNPVKWWQLTDGNE